MVSRQSGGQLRCLNRRPAGAIESASGSDSASGIAAKAIESINLIALACVATSLRRVLIDPSLGGVIAKAYSDRVATDDRDGSATV